MKTANEPIVLSGRVFVAKLLAEELTHLRMPERVNAGDVKLIAVPKGKGYAGFIRAYIAEGSNRWRNLALKKKAAVSATYDDQPGRRERARQVAEHVRSLAGYTATWQGKTYEVLYNAPSTRSAESRATTAAKKSVASPAAGVVPNAGDVPRKSKEEAAQVSKPVQLTLF